jgi:hypothetical protein
VIVKSVARAAASAARDAVRVVTAVGSHAMWWLDYHATHGHGNRGPDDDRR